MHKNRNGFRDGVFQKMPWSARKKWRLYRYRDSMFGISPAVSGRSEGVNHSVPFNLNPWGGSTLKIKFDRYEVKEQTSAKSNKPYKMCHVHGVAVGGKLDGQDYTTKFFGNNKELLGQVEGLIPGEIVDVEMKKNGQYWNPVGFKGEGIPAAGGATGGSGAVAMVENPRLTNLKIAIDILGSIGTDQEPFDYIQDAAGVADLIQHYVDETGAFQFANTTDEIPGDDEDD